MSKLKFSDDLFLEKAELNRLKKFLDDDGFRAFLLYNSVKFGFIKKENASFINGLVQEDTGFTVSINEARLIDSAGNLIYSPLIQQLAVSNDNQWYWIKIIYTSSSKEKGTFSIDTSGNLVCTSGDAELLTILRGQPNYPSRIKFLNASSNILEYDVEEVIDNNNAVLTGNFTAEANLTLSVIGTFTAGYVPIDSEKNIFQYDSSTITLIQSNTSTEPAHTVGTEFFLARVKRNGSSLKIEDKRNDIWTTNANYFIKHLTSLNNPLIGIEQITYDDPFSPRDKNIIEFSWGFRAVTFTVDLKNNKITISAGSGGIFRSINFNTVFTDGDFDNWRVYGEDGKYYKVKSSALNGGNIELVFDNLEATSFFSDVDSTTPISQILAVVPEAEEIEIICVPDQDISDPSDTNGIVEERRVFPINELYGRMKLIVYNQTLANYAISYRYKQLDSYGPELVIPDDVLGYYNEEQFNTVGFKTGSVRTSYINGIVTLKLSPKSFFNFQNKIDIGDFRGVDTVALSNAVPLVNLVVGQNRQYQYYTGGDLTLSANMFINLDKIDIDGLDLRNGNSLMLHFKQKISLSTFSLIIGEKYIDPTHNTPLKTFTADDSAFLSNSEAGIFILCTYDLINKRWILNSTNESLISRFNIDWTSFLITTGVDPVGGTLTSIDSNSYFRYKIIGKTMFFQFHLELSFTTGSGVIEINTNLASIFKTANDATGGFIGAAIDMGDVVGKSFLARIPSNSGIITIIGDANIVAGTYEYGINGTVNIQ